MPALSNLGHPARFVHTQGPGVLLFRRWPTTTRTCSSQPNEESSACCVLSGCVYARPHISMPKVANREFARSKTRCIDPLSFSVIPVPHKAFRHPVRWYNRARSILSSVIITVCDPLLLHRGTANPDTQPSCGTRVEEAPCPDVDWRSRVPGIRIAPEPWSLSRLGHPASIVGLVVVRDFDRTQRLI